MNDSICKGTKNIWNDKIFFVAYLRHARGWDMKKPQTVQSGVIDGACLRHAFIAVFLQHLDGFDDAFTNLDSFLVLGNEVPVALGQGVLQTFVDVLLVDDGFQLEEATEDHHVEDLADAELLGFGGSGDLVDVDVLTGGLVGDAVGVIDEVTAGLHAALKLTFSSE